MAKVLSEIDAALVVSMSPELLRWLTSYAPKPGGRKLPFEERDGEYFYDRSELLDFDAFLSAPWAHHDGQRPPVPAGIRREIQIEAHSTCAVCPHMNDGEAAHIVAVAKSFNNHPSNLIWLCPNHHTAYDYGHRIHANLKKDVIQAYKDMLVESNLRRWRMERRSTHALLLFIKDLETARTLCQDAANKMTAGAQAFTSRVLAEVNAAAKRISEAPMPAIATGHSKAYSTLARVALTASQASPGEAVRLLSTARDGYLVEASEVSCPLCNGEGSFGRFETCPICVGDGVVDEATASSVDLEQFLETPCPLCKGKGNFRDYDECPECGGAGALTHADAQQVDVTAYQLQKCPLCKGRGSYGDYDHCPECSGSGKVERRHAEQVDLASYERTTCPLCDGTGKYGFRDDCPVCGGEGEVEINSLRQIDLTDYDLVKCPPCRGSGSLHGEECGACEGNGQVERKDLPDIEQDFRMVPCPLCRGTGQFRNYDECPVCEGEKMMEARTAQQIDTSDFALVKCPSCRSEGCDSCEYTGKVERRHL